VVLVEIREVTELHQQPAEVTERTAQNPPPLRIRQLGQRETQIVQSRLAPAGGEMKSQPCHRFRGGIGGAARHPAEGFEESARGRILQAAFNADFHPWYLRILLNTSGWPTSAGEFHLLRGCRRF